MTASRLFTHIAFAAVLAAIAYGITWMMCHRVRIMDRPSDRTAHETAVPRAGGVSIVATWLIGMALIAFLGKWRPVEHIYLEGFVLSSLVVAMVSLCDDIWNTSALFRLVSQTIAVLVALQYGIVLDRVADFTLVGWVAYLISFFWILGLTNAYNFMDGLDGLAAGVAVIVSLYFMGITYYQGSTFTHITCYTILAGAFGFLWLNWPPARIFLGDVGAVFLGFVFATLAIIAARYDASHTSFLVMPLLLFNFIFDTSFTFIRRLLIGENVSRAHRTHLYQLLHRTGFSHLEVSLLQYCMVFLQGLGALWLVRILGNERLLVFAPYLLFQIVYAVVVYRRATRFGIPLTGQPT